MWRAAIAAACALLAWAPVLTGAQAQQRETISFESHQKGQPVQVTAEITWPANTGLGPVPAMVIHHGSGGVGEREARYVRELVPMGVATVVIDSFKPRGVTSTVLDQSAVTGFRTDFSNGINRNATRSDAFPYIVVLCDRFQNA